MRRFLIAIALSCFWYTPSFAIHPDSYRQPLFDACMGAAYYEGWDRDVSIDMCTCHTEQIIKMLSGETMLDEERVTRLRQYVDVFVRDWSVLGLTPYGYDEDTRTRRYTFYSLRISRACRK